MMMRALHGVLAMTLLLATNARAQRPAAWLGLAVAGESPVVIEDVFPGGPADRAGVLPGDVLLHVNGRLVTHRGVDSVFSRVTFGEVVLLSVRRGASTSDIRVMPSTRPALDAASGGLVVDVDSVRMLASAYLDGAQRMLRVVAPSGFTAVRSDSGLIVSGGGGRMRINIDSVTARGRRLPAGGSYTDTIGSHQVRVARERGDHVQGMLVTDMPAVGGDSIPKGVLFARMDSTSPLTAFALQPLDIIVQLNGIPVTNVETLRRAAENAAQVNVIAVLRRGQLIVLRKQEQ